MTAWSALLRNSPPPRHSCRGCKFQGKFSHNLGCCPQLVNLFPQLPCQSPRTAGAIHPALHQASRGAAFLQKAVCQSSCIPVGRALPTLPALPAAGSAVFQMWMMLGAKRKLQAPLLEPRGTSTHSTHLTRGHTPTTADKFSGAFLAGGQLQQPAERDSPGSPGRPSGWAGDRGSSGSGRRVAAPREMLQQRQR